jgi:antitoxin component YwqK of YwqJK toxin-antitoxin module
MLKELDKTKPYYFQQSGICWDSEKKEIFFDDTRWEEGYAKPDINGGKLYNGEVRHYYQKKRRIARGKVASVTLYKNGIKNGLCMRFKKNGKLNWAVEYKNGVIMRVLYKK